jgi:hypothetical protein
MPPEIHRYPAVVEKGIVDVEQEDDRGFGHI